MLRSDPRSPEEAAVQQSEAKLFHKLQRLLCYTWESSLCLQLKEKVLKSCQLLKNLLY